MGTVYDIPITNESTVITTGLIVGTRVSTGRKFRVGANIEGAKIAAYVHDDIIYRYISSESSAGENGIIVSYNSPWTFYAYTGLTATGTIYVVPVDNPEYFNPRYTISSRFYNSVGERGVSIAPSIDAFNTSSEALQAMGISMPGKYPITYRPTNCSFPNAPAKAAVGDTVVVPVVFPDGYGLVNDSNIYVTNNGVVIPSTYTNGQLTFTMPNPAQ